MAKWKFLCDIKQGAKEPNRLAERFYMVACKNI